MAGILSKFPVAQNPSRLPSTRLSPLPLGVLGLESSSSTLWTHPPILLSVHLRCLVLLLPWTQCGMFSTTSSFFQNWDPTKVWNLIKCNAGLRMPRSVTQMPIKLQECLEEVPFNELPEKSHLCFSHHGLIGQHRTFHLTWFDYEGLFPQTWIWTFSFPAQGFLIS